MLEGEVTSTTGEGVAGRAEGGVIAGGGGGGGGGGEEEEYK